MKTTLIATFAAAALMASASVVLAKSIDGIGSGGIKSESHSRVIANMAKAKLCDNIDANAVYDAMRADARATSAEQAISVTEVYHLANLRSNRIISSAKRDAWLPQLTKTVCAVDASSLSHYSGFAHSRIPIDVNARLSAKLAAQDTDDKALDFIVLRASARNCDFSFREKVVADGKLAGLKKAIKQSAFDHEFLVTAALSRDDVNAAYKEKFGSLSECEAGKQLVVKYGEIRK